MSKANVLARAWARDDIVGRLLRNGTYIFSAGAVMALLGLVALSLIARALGPAGFGILVMIEAYTRLVERFIRLEPWQAVIRYGAEALEQERRDEFKQLIKFATLIDIAGAMLAAGLAAAGARLAAGLLGWDEETADMATVFSLAIALHLPATPTAVLRLFDRFGALASAQAVLAVARLVLVAIAFILGGGLWTFLLVFMLCQTLEGLVPFAMAWIELRRRGYGGSLMTPLRGVTDRFPGIWGFIWSSNASLLFRKSTYQLDTLVVGGLIDPGAAGLYNVARRLGDAVLMVGRPIQQAIFPDVARLWARGEIAAFRSIVLMINLATGGFIAVCVLLLTFQIGNFLNLAFGGRFVEASDLVILQMVGATMFLTAVSLRPALMSAGHHREVLAITTLATFGFYFALAGGVPLLGAIGAPLAHVVFNAIWLVGALTVFLRVTGDAARRRSPGASDLSTLESDT